MSTVALNFVGGIPFQLLYDGIKIAIRRTSKFRSNLINLQFTLDCLQSRIIEQIGENNVELNLPNNIIEGIQTKMNEGVALVAMLSELRAWNIRIWGNCYNCIGPNCADQLDELDRSLRSLLDQLELEQRRNVTRLMILAINARDKQDELEKRQLDILKGQQQILGMLMEQHHAIGKIVSSSVQVASSTGGGGGTAPALGLVFRLLFDAVTQVRVKNEMVKRLLRRFKSTLNYLQPLIEEVAKSKRVLHLSEQEVEMFISEVENGVELIHKCSKVSKRVNYKKYKYTNKILDLDKSLQRLFFELKGQVERNLKEAMDSANTIEAVIKKIEGGADQQKSELKSESQSSVPQPGSFTIGLDIPNEQGHRDMNKDTQVDSTRNVEVVTPIEKSDAVQHQMETKSSCEVPPSPAGGLDVLNLQGSLDIDSTTSNIEAGVMDMEGIEVDDLKTNVHVKGTLEFAINIEKMGLMGVKKIEGGGGSKDIKIAVAETEPLSPAVRLDVQDEVHGTRDAKVTLEIRKNVKDAITTAAEPSSPSAEVGVKLDSSAFPSSSPLCTQAELKLPDKEKVSEEVDQILRPSSSLLTIGPSLRIQALEPSSLYLVFGKSLSLPIFTESKISDEDNNQIQILVVDNNMISSGSHQIVPISLPHPVKVEIVVLDGDFPSGDRKNWTSQEFNNNVLKERTGKRPLLTGDVNVTVRDGFAMIGDIEFTDNSSWIRSRRFRLGARVAPGFQGPRIREAITDAFVVKDHRGGSYNYIRGMGMVMGVSAEANFERESHNFSRSAPTSVFSSPAVCPRRSNFADPFPFFMPRQDLYQDGGATFSSLLLSPKNSTPILGPNHSPLHSPTHRSLCFSPTNASNYDTDSLATAHLLPLPPGAVVSAQPQSIVMHQNLAPNVAVSSMKGQWQKGKLIGRGTFGSVYLATNRETGALCAMKEVDLIPDDPKSAGSIKQLEQEIKVLRTLKHPNIVQYYGSEMIDDHFYIYVEYVHPGSINKYVRDHIGAMTESVVRNFTRHILHGLAYLHDTKTIHRDIKCSNLLVDASGVVKIADFGMAKHLGAHSYNLSLKGSPYWMAPEVIKAVIQNDGDPNLASAVDIWSLGCTIIELFNGKPPWSEFEGPQAMFKVMHRTPDIPERLSAEGKEFLSLCFQRNPAERPSAKKLLDHPFVRISNDQNVSSYSRAFSLDKLNSPRDHIKQKLGRVLVGPRTSNREVKEPGSLKHAMRSGFGSSWLYEYDQVENFQLCVHKSSILEEITDLTSS